jgi:DNA polymerase-4
VAGQCLKRVPLEQRLRLLGVRVGALARQAEVYAGAGPGAPPTAREPGALLQTGQLF